MKLLVHAAIVCLISASAVNAQAVNQHVKKIGNQIITEIEVVNPPPPYPGKLPPGVVSADPIVMKTNDWYCGRLFTDDQGCRWRLVSGPKMDFNPDNLSGWRLVAAEGKQSFFTITGRLFQRISCPPELLATPLSRPPELLAPPRQ